MAGPEGRVQGSASQHISSLHVEQSAAQDDLQTLSKSMAPRLDDLEDADERNYSDHPNLSYENITHCNWICGAGIKSLGTSRWKLSWP